MIQTVIDIEESKRQKAELQAIIDSLEPISDEEFDQILAKSEPVEDHERLDPELEEKLKAKIAKARAKRKKKAAAA